MSSSFYTWIADMRFSRWSLCSYESFSSICTHVSPLMARANQASQIPIAFFKFKNVFRSRALVKISANCLDVGTYSMTTIFPSTKSLTKWYLMAICFVFECITGVFDIFVALWFSQWTKRGLEYIPYSASMCFIHNSCVQQLPRAMYSASAVDNNTHFWILLFQDTMLFSKNKHPPDVLLLSSKLPAQSTSQKPARLVLVSLV